MKLHGSSPSSSAHDTHTYAMRSCNNLFFNSKFHENHFNENKQPILHLLSPKRNSLRSSLSLNVLFVCLLRHLTNDIEKERGTKCQPMKRMKCTNSVESKMRLTNALYMLAGMPSNACSNFATLDTGLTLFLRMSLSLSLLSFLVLLLLLLQLLVRCRCCCCCPALKHESQIHYALQMLHCNVMPYYCGANICIYRCIFYIFVRVCVCACDISWHTHDSVCLE